MGPLPTGSLPSLTTGFLRIEAKLRMHFVHCQDAFGYHRNPTHIHVGQGGEEVIGKILGFPMTLNHGKAFLTSTNHIQVDFRDTRIRGGSQAPPPIFQLACLSVCQPGSLTASCMLGDTMLTILQYPTAQSFATRDRWLLFPQVQLGTSPEGLKPSWGWVRCPPMA